MVLAKFLKTCFSNKEAKEWNKFFKAVFTLRNCVHSAFVSNRSWKCTCKYYSIEFKEEKPVQFLAKDFIEIADCLIKFFREVDSESVYDHRKFKGRNHV